MLKVMYLRTVPEPTFFGYVNANRKLAAGLGVFALTLCILAGAAQQPDVEYKNDLERCRAALLYPSAYELESGYTPTINDACLNDIPQD